MAARYPDQIEMDKLVSAEVVEEDAVPDKGSILN